MAQEENTASVFETADVSRLKRLAELMIPPSSSAPGASDPAIFTRVLNHLAASCLLARAALDELDVLAESRHGASFLSLTKQQQESLCPDSLNPEFRAMFELLVATCYFSDPSVMRTLGVPPRPPFPVGYKVPETDWSLLEPVKQRGPIYRLAD
jgi:hypothetical protein